MDFYENARAACARKGKTITEVLRETGFSTGLVGAWKGGMLPKLYVVIRMAEYLDMSIDELVYGPERLEKWISRSSPESITEEQREWLDIINSIPYNKREVCKAFLRTHMIEDAPAKYEEGKMA